MMQNEHTRNLKYRDYVGHLTHQMLDAVYYEYGKSFKTHAEALLFANGHKGSIVTRLVNYHNHQLDHRGTPLPGAKPHEIGWQVTLPQSWRGYQETKIIPFFKAREANKC